MNLFYNPGPGFFIIIVLLLMCRCLCFVFLLLCGMPWPVDYYYGITWLYSHRFVQFHQVYLFKVFFILKHN